MKRAAPIVVVIVAFGLSAGRASAQFYSGNDLYDKCQSTVTGTANICFGYIMGIVDYITIIQEFDIVKKTVCMRPGMTASQIKDVAMNHMKANPKNRDWSAATLVGIALRDAFPCPADK